MKKKRKKRKDEGNLKILLNSLQEVFTSTALLGKKTCQTMFLHVVKDVKELSVLKYISTVKTVVEQSF